MKKLRITLIRLFIGFQCTAFGQAEKDVVSKISGVTVYTSGAQIESYATVEVQQGKMLLHVKNLSPFINKESIRVEGDGNYTILNVQLQNDYLNELEKTKEMDDLAANIQQYKNKIEDEETWITILQEKLEFLKSNKNVAGKDQTINPETFKLLTSIYGDNIEKYSMDLLKRKRMIKEYNKEVDKLANQLNQVNSRNGLPSGVITVTINAKKSASSTIKLTYLVDNASWYPSYDIRFGGTTKPVSISFKANINQSTGVDWKDVDVKLSTAKTNISAQIPSLVTTYLHYNQPTYEVALRGSAAGVVVQSQDGAPDANSAIQIRGVATIIGDSKPLYVIDGVVVGNNANFLNPSDVENIEILKDASATAIYGSRGANGVILVTTKKEKNTSDLPLIVISKNETTSEYQVDAKQTINSDNKLNTIMFKEISIKADYEYQSIPKLSKNVYLIGKLSNWYKADLMDGEANIYMENSFVGKSTINTQQYKDTLDISFGIDNNISVNREKIRDFSETQFMGSNKKETFAWKLTIRNNKAYAAKVKLFDQVPVSSVKDFQVEPLELSGGTLNPVTGKIQWTINLQPNETKQVIVKYSVKYPKSRNLVIE